jgi:hypothetical protein
VRSPTVWPALLRVEKTVVERVEFGQDEEMLVAHVPSSAAVEEPVRDLPAAVSGV